MIKAWYNSSKERKQGNEEMESDGWIVYEESLTDNKVHVTYLREIEFEEFDEPRGFSEDDKFSLMMEEKK
jgi:hypothetical protein